MTRDYRITVKIDLHDCSLTRRELAEAVEDSSIGEFGNRLWKLGELFELRVTKVVAKD